MANGSHVIYAQGFDIDLALDIAKRLVSSVCSSSRARSVTCLAPAKALGYCRRSDHRYRARSRNLTFSPPYMTVDQGVLAASASALSPHRSRLAFAAGVCPAWFDRGRRGEDADRSLQARFAADSVPVLMLDLQKQRLPGRGLRRAVPRCDEVAAPSYYGPFVGLIPTGEHYGIAMPKGSPIAGQVDEALGALIAGGTVQRLEEKWLTADLAKLPVLH